MEGLGFAVSEITITTLLPDLKSAGFVLAPTPTPQPSVSSGIYTSDKYWYSIEVPEGWELDASDDNLVAIWDSRTGSTVWVEVEEIIPDVYPTLDSYISAWEPGPAEGWTDFQLTSQHRIRADQPVEAEQFIYTYDSKGDPNRGVSHWYILGRYNLTVLAVADQAVWELDTYINVRETLVGIQESFQPSIYTSAEYGYSVAHSLEWKVYGTLFDPATMDYYASSTIPVGIDISTYVLSDLGYPSVLEYGDASFQDDPDILSRKLLFLDRPIAGYRLDYAVLDNATSRTIRGAYLITFTGGNAVWVEISTYIESWNDIESLVSDIFLRVAVVP